MKILVSDFKSNNFEETFLNSILTTGFGVIINHDIDPYLIKEVQLIWRNFFLQNTQHKNFYVTSNPNRGYHGFKKETAVGSNSPDLKEFFHYQPGGQLPHGTESVTINLFQQLEEMGLKLLQILDKGHKNRSISYHESCVNTDNTILRTLYYPALDFELEKGSVRAAAHEDVNFITLLVAASSPGLEVLDKEGKWHPVPHTENSIVVNIGDMLQFASNGYYKSTTHRVINPSDSKEDRISMPLFMHPNGSTILSDNITAQQFLNKRLDIIYGSKK